MLYNLLIVDDEPAVVDTLADTIEWEELNILEVYRAYSGKEAYRYLENNRVDVVILDIKMPGVSGLDIARDIHRCWPYAKVIMLSGFSDFEYAQDAIDSRVFRYLTKPTPCDEIKRVVEYALKSLEKEWDRLNVAQVALKQLNEVRPILRERYLNGWICQGKIETKTAIEKMKTYDININYDNAFSIILIRIDDKVKLTPSNEEEMYELAMKDTIKTILLRDQSYISFKDNNENYIVVVAEESLPKVSKTMDYVEKMAGLFQAAVSSSLGYVVSIFWGDVSQDINEVHEAYNALITRNRRVMLQKTGVIIGANIQELNSQSTNTPLKSLYANPDFTVLIETNQKRKALERIDEIFREIEKRNITSTKALMEIYYKVAGGIISDSNKRGFVVDEWAGDRLPYFYNFDRFQAVFQLKEWCIGITNSYINYVKELEKNKSTYVIEQAKSIIIESLGQELSVSDLAASLFIHPNYLSTLFKEHVGISITDYMIQLKIKKAQRLLKRPGIKVYEVAELVGYESVPSFNRIFRKIVGITPKEFQSETPIS